MDAICNLCERPLGEPFKTRIFYDDGREETLINELAPSGITAVVVYGHSACWDKDIVEPVVSSKKPKIRPLRDVISREEAWRLIGERYRIIREGKRFLLLLPKP